MRVYLSVLEERKVAVVVDCVAGATDLGCGVRRGPNHARLLLRDDASLSRERSRKCPPRPGGLAIVGKSDFRSVCGRRASILNGTAVTTRDRYTEWSSECENTPFYFL